MKATIVEKKEEQKECNTKIKDLEANLADAKGYRERQLKEAKANMEKLKGKADKSRKEWEKREKVCKCFESTLFRDDSIFQFAFIH